MELERRGILASEEFEGSLRFFLGLSWLVWVLRILLQFQRCVPFSECGLSFVSFVVPLCFAYCSDSRKEGVHHLLNEVLGLSCFNTFDVASARV